MKRALMFAMFVILMAGFALALGDNSGKNNGSPEEHALVGSSCGTVTPGYQDACCVSKGYSGWDNDTFACIGENDTEESGNGMVGAINANRRIDDEHQMECEAWNCTRWSACVNGTEARKCTKTVFNCTTDNKIPALTKNCHEKEEFKFYNKTRDCPENCTCAGATTKCEFENGTKVMTIFAGESGNIIVQIQDLNMSTNVTLYRLDGKFFGIFKDNDTHQIILPDYMKGKLENRTRTKFYNESINLGEDGKYYMNATKRARLFWIFPVREHMEAQVNATTGEALSIRNPWWGFLAKDVKDNTNSSEGQ